jgi:hypothetical protein
MKAGEAYNDKNITGISLIPNNTSIALYLRLGAI